MSRPAALRRGVLVGLGAVAVAMAGVPAAAPVTAVAAACAPSDHAAHPVSDARVRPGTGAVEPRPAPDNEAKAYGALQDRPTLPAGSVSVDTVFHVVTASAQTVGQRARTERMIRAQMDVLNAAFAGTTAPDAADTPFRFDLVETTWTVNAAWAGGAPGKDERAMKRALHTGDSETMNVYSLDLGSGLLGYAYYPKGYNEGRDYVDGVVILDESMPGGTAGIYAEGDTLTHEVGHWLALAHTFDKGCSAAGDFVADTPKEAEPAFGCAEGRDTCTAPGLDPVHNFMDYSQDSCMDMFTRGQADRMSDAWLQFRAGGQG